LGHGRSHQKLFNVVQNQQHLFVLQITTKLLSWRPATGKFEVNGLGDSGNKAGVILNRYQGNQPDAIGKFADMPPGKLNIALAEELYAESFVNLNPTPGLPADREGTKMEIATYHQAFPDMAVTIDDIVSEGDKAVAHYTIRGTNSGDLMGMPPTGKAAEITGISMLRLANGQVVEEFSLADMMGLFQQLGLAPEMA
jgi:steroid delta-isomerase-like uncharacterized protein